MEIKEVVKGAVFVLLGAAVGSGASAAFASRGSTVSNSKPRRRERRTQTPVEEMGVQEMHLRILNNEGGVIGQPILLKKNGKGWIGGTSASGPRAFSVEPRGR